MEQDLALILPSGVPNLNSSFTSQQSRKSFNLFMEGVRNSDLSRGSDLSQGNRASIEALRRRNPRLPTSELMEDLYQEIPHTANGGAALSFRTSLESVKENEGRAEMSGIDLRIEEPAPMADQADIFGEGDISLEEEEECKESPGYNSNNTDNTDNDASCNVTHEPSWEQPISLPKSLQPSISLLPNPKKEAKCCSCKKTKCLKLYCECFANSQYCKGCNCTGCHNLEAFDEERAQALAQIARNNPAGLNRRMSIAEGTEAKLGSGCNCTKTKCRKNYCECYKLGMACGTMCNCEGCRNKKARKVK